VVILVQVATGATEEYDGATWTSNPTGLNTARQYLGGCGIQTAALAFGGYVGVPTTTGATEEYNGSTWTSSPASLATARQISRKCRNTSICFSFWRRKYWTPSTGIQQQQKNGQVQVLH
jgi:hypothetical protein